MTYHQPLSPGMILVNDPDDPAHSVVVIDRLSRWLVYITLRDCEGEDCDETTINRHVFFHLCDHWTIMEDGEPVETLRERDERFNPPEGF